MKLRIAPTVYCVLWLCSFTPTSTAQERPRIEVQRALINDLQVVMQPLAPTRLPELEDLHRAKLSSEGEELQLVVMVEAFRTEKKEGPVTSFTQELRTRIIQVDGKPLEQTYTVQIPVTEFKETEVKIPAGRKPLTVPASECRFFDLQGEEIAATDAAERLRSLQPIFLLDGMAADTKLPEIPAIVRQAVKEECLIVTTTRVIRENRRILRVGQALPAMQFVPAIPAVPARAAEQVLPGVDPSK